MTRRLAVTVQNAVPNAPAPTRADIRKWVAAALRGRRGEITVRIVAAEESADLNHRYRKRAGATNVLSFPAGDETPLPAGETQPLGDLVVCAEVVEREALEQHKTLAAHWAHIVIHGALHLAGYDHEGETQARAMEARERELLADFGFPDPYAASA